MHRDSVGSELHDDALASALDRLASVPAACSICLETLGSSAAPSLVRECLHAFCFPCILQWSAASAFVPTCPLCKQEFRQLVCDIGPGLSFSLQSVGWQRRRRASSPPHSQLMWHRTARVDSARSRPVHGRNMFDVLPTGDDESELSRRRAKYVGRPEQARGRRRGCGACTSCTWHVAAIRAHLLRRHSRRSFR